MIEGFASIKWVIGVGAARFPNAMVSGVFGMNRSIRSFAGFACLVLIISAADVFAQSDTRRTTVAITYPLDQTIEVPFHGTTRLPRLKGSASVRRQGRRGTRVQLHLDNLPR